MIPCLSYDDYNFSINIDFFNKVEVIEENKQFQ